MGASYSSKYNLILCILFSFLISRSIFLSFLRFPSRCDYASLTGDTAQLLSGNSSTPFVEVGLSAYRSPVYNEDSDQWTMPFQGSCVRYPPDVVTFDASWNVAKGCAFCALVFGGGGALFLWFSSCFVFSPITWRWAGYEVFIASILQTLTFVWFNTSMCKTNGSDCSLFFGSKLDIIAAVFWMVSAISIFLKYPKPSPKLSGIGSSRSSQQVDGDAEMSTIGPATASGSLSVRESLEII